jgi:membrane fusion protein (multidrug efflux system)
MAEQSSIRVVAGSDEIAPSAEKQDSDFREAKAEAAAPKPAPVIAAPVKPKRKRSFTRPVLFTLLPVALLVGGFYYVNGGQIMSTDNAYVETDMVGLTTDVSGIVDQINVHENEHVKAGQTLFSLRPNAFRITLAGAQAQLGVQRNQILNLKASYQQSKAEIIQAEADLPYYQTQFDRQEVLVKNAASKRSDFDQAKHDLDAAKQKVAVARAQAGTTLAQLGGNADQKVEDNPLYLQAKAAVEDAQRQLDNSVVKAPFDGVVTNVSSLQVGSYLESATQAFSLVAANHLWIAASPKETELTYVKPGQRATITVDAYPGVEWKGEIESISPASGSSFSLLPAQNTTGNWVKVVQRIPMRVSILDPQGKPPLRVGMSTIVDVDTGHIRGLPDFLSNLLASLGLKSWESYIVKSHG